MPSDSRPAERKPIDAVIVSPSATPSWPQPGGRYSMSPGSSSHSSVGAKSARIFSGVSVRNVARFARPMRQRRRPATWSRKTS